MDGEWEGGRRRDQEIRRREKRGRVELNEGGDGQAQGGGVSLFGDQVRLYISMDYRERWGE